MKRIACTMMCIVMLLNAEVKSIKKTIPVKGTQGIELKGFSGATLNIKSWEKNEIAIDIKIEYTSSNKEYEHEFIQKTDITLEETGGGITLSYKEPKSLNEGFSLQKLVGFLFSSYSNSTITGEITVPAANNLSAELQYGEYSIDGIKGTLELTGVSNTLRLINCAAVKKVENNYGKTNIERSGGTLMLEATSSNVFIQDFNGEVDAKADYSTMTLNTITGRSSVSCVSGKVDMDGIGSDVTLHVNYSTVRLEKVKGMASVESQSGTIRVKEVMGANINAPYSNITLETISTAGEPVIVKNISGTTNIYNCTREVLIEDSYSKINLEGIQGSVTFSGTSSELYGKRINGNIKMNNEYGNIILDELTATTIEIINKNNTVDIELTNKPGKINIINEYGSVNLTFPDFSGDVKLKASYGNVKTNLPIEVEEFAGGEIAMGKVGNGNGTISVKTTSGNIAVHQKK